MPTAVGMRFGRYELLERLGAGAMGEVFRARDHDLGRDVAIKFLSERFASDSERLARFTQEARAASSLNHPNIVTVHEIGEASGLPFIVMELVDGRTLRRLLVERPLSAREMLDVGVQLADGLAKAHAAGIVHRDLKPENVMVTKDGFVKILDFGLAKLRAEEPLDSASGSDDLATLAAPATTAGAILGTPGYMSPEQARGEPAGHRADQFAVGALLYELATRRAAFRGKSFVQTLNAVIEREPEAIAALNPDVPPPARWIIERCLEKDPERRYASTQDLARELRSVREHLSEVRSAGSGTWRRPAFRVSRGSLRLAIVLAVIVAGIFLAPRLKPSISRWMQRPVLPAEMRVALLPVSVAGVGEDTRCCAGLLDYIAVRLADLGRLQGDVSVVPVSELLAAGVNSPSAARRAVGATIAVSVGVHGAGDTLLVTVSLADTEKVRQLPGVTKTFPRSAFSPEDVVNLLVPLLDVQLQARQKAAWAGGASGVVDASVLYAQGLAQTPYQTAQNQLERYDQARSLEQAIKLFNDAIDLDPRYAAAHAALGEARVRLYRLTRQPSDLTLAEQSSRYALALDSTRPGAWMTLGMVLTQRGDTEGAEKAFGEAIARNPNGGDTYRELGLAYQRARALEKADAAYRKAIELQPKSWANYNYYGAFLNNAVRRFPEAEAAYRRALELAPENGRVWSNLGALYLFQKRWDEADATLRTAIRHHSVTALSNLGYLQFVVRRQMAEAAATFQQAVDAAPRDARMWRNLAVARYWTPALRSRAPEAYRQAATLFEEELKIDPTNAGTLAELADCRGMLGDRAAARSLATKALKAGLAQDDWITVVGVFEEIGDRAEAIRQARSAFQAGVTPQDFEEAVSFDDMRKDPRYAALVGQMRPKKAGNR